MKKMIIIFVLALLTYNSETFAQLKKLPPKKAETINSWLDQYSTFITLDAETRSQIYSLYERRYLEKDSIHHLPGLSKSDKKRMKIGVDKKTNTALAQILTKDDYLYIRCHHLTLGRLKQIKFITDLGAIQEQRLTMAMREMRFKNMLLMDQYGKSNLEAKEKMKQNREICANIEQQVFSDDMYQHLYKMNLLTVVDWSTGGKKEQDVTEAILDGYNVLDPMETLN